MSRLVGHACISMEYLYRASVSGNDAGNNSEFFVSSSYLAPIVSLIGKVCPTFHRQPGSRAAIYAEGLFRRAANR